jgi:hypothetical protein
LADAHLVALCDAKALLDRLYQISISPLIDKCAEALERVRNNFHIVDGAMTKRQAEARDTPQLKEISSAWVDGMERARSFPIVHIVTGEEPKA